MSNIEMSAETPTKAMEDRCCDKCDTPRSLLQFRKNQMWITSRPEGDDDMCAMCQSPYGSEDLTSLLVDESCTINDFPHCNHTLGSACLNRMFRTAEVDTTITCPLCRTP
ncbi:hypothetical protein CC86DRAFT_153196 [Ophiobolus disseminans]|uniref:RING-type domain-containing protein n=1 Tax=Ophiobolus disseminans TaxID=1469910 RepID=A0A6A6ZC76_9PLEO|nr:hypothetical protein CC86DRAFT_153196 [Ophiobolus disseminans]